MSEKNKFSKREWIHLIITLSIVQAAIWFVSFVYANNSSALGYISFAGTIISIILAVLAIGYTYGESQQQKSSSQTLANQIDELVKIKDSLKIQADALEDIKMVKNTVLSFSNKVDSHFIETQKQVSDVSNFIRSITSIPKVQSFESEDKVKFLDGASKFTDLYQSVVYCIVAIFIDVSLKKEGPIVYSDLEKILENANYDLSKIYGIKQVFYGGCVIACNSLIHLGLLVFENKYVDPELINFFNICDNNLSQFKGSSDMVENLQILHEEFSKIQFIK